MTAQSKVYSGKRGRFSNAVELRLDLFNRSPTGFEWAMAARVPRNWRWRSSPTTFGDDAAAVRLHQQFKWSVTAKLNRAGWRLSSREIDRWLAERGE
jgi:hypothetical protein